MALSYEFSIGSVRAKENSLFSVSDIEHMLGCKDITELCRYLNDKGYGDGSDIEEILTSHPCTINNEDIIKAVENRRFSAFPEWLAKPADRAYETLAHTADARLSDAILDRAVMEQMLITAHKVHSDFVLDYFKTTVFYNNIKIAIRAARTGTDRDFLNNAFCDVEDFPKKSIIDAVLKGSAAVHDILSKLSAYGCNKAMAAYDASPSEFERFVDNKLIVMAKENCKRSGEGAEPLMGYLIGSEAEKKVIHIIANGLRTDSDTEIIRGRLREIYG